MCNENVNIENEEYFSQSNFIITINRLKKVVLRCSPDYNQNLFSSKAKYSLFVLIHCWNKG